MSKISKVILVIVTVPFLIWQYSLFKSNKHRTKPYGNRSQVTNPLVSSYKRQRNVSDRAKQNDRQKLIAKMKNLNIVSKIEKLGGNPYVTVGPRFYILNFEDKQTFISVIYAFYKESAYKSDYVVLQDYYNGKRIGQMNAYGLSLD